ncbi:C4-dicarboxylate ABC transporter [Rhodovulum sulfidophilum]|uniref:TRAP transporter large permease protein n=1 Tax=Rhodovulum visakhapatnamense TaxID=364297 RepID=A0ABS1RDP9_9RHOB|nr:TRAP transporter large permease [Rhodovulum visakhapatnamense]MBL3570175.1 TRAP transporter large permease [Rhodovulum visakhapatnamense]MBL3577624.1 TRAP transporter large permease [Rhodovulum visakhapatnamense]OLS43520.1 C4-dicarboxylate ABC transporter [Rhodovulum sulfidophilum]
MLVIAAAFVLLLLAGVPVVFVLGASAVIALVTTTDVPVTIVSQRVFAGLNTFTLMSIPFFVFAGVIMDAGGISRRIVEFASAVIGWVIGSLLQVSCLAAAGLAAISGSGSADTAAISAIMQPQLRRRGYDVDFGAAIIASAGSIAQVIPPSLTMVILAVVSNVSIGALFLSGVVPGLMCIAILMVIAYFHARKGGPAYRETEPFTFARLLRTGWAALPATGMPVLILGGILGGVFTPTEAAAVSGFYGLLVGAFLYRDLDLKRLPDLILRTVSLSAAVMLIIGTASVFSWLIANANVPQLLGNWIASVSSSTLMFLLIANLLFLFVGMFLETIAAILIIVPVLSPIAAQMGVDPIHFSLLIILNCAIGTVTPPYGVSLFVASSVAGRPVLSVARKLALPLAGLFAVLVAVTLIPDLPLFLPRLAGLID